MTIYSFEYFLQIFLYTYSKKQIRIFESEIAVSVKAGESNFNSKNIIEYQPKNNVAIAYNEFVKEYVANKR